MLGEQTEQPFSATEETLKIAKELNEENITTSSAYNKTGNIIREPGEPQIIVETSALAIKSSP